MNEKIDLYFLREKIGSLSYDSQRNISFLNIVQHF